MSKLKLMVCPHDTARNPEKWFIFAQHISLKLRVELSFDIATDFKNFHEKFHEADIIYANPRDTLKLIDDNGYTSLARPDGVYDEVVFIAGNDIEKPSLKSLRGERIATVLSMLPTNIALHLLKKQSVKPGKLLDKDSWLSVMNSVRTSEVNYGFVYKDTYDDLSDLSKSLFSMFHVSRENLAFHSICISPKSADLTDSLTELLTGMDDFDEGREVLKDLAFTRWVSVTEPELQTVRDVVSAYV